MRYTVDPGYDPEDTRAVDVGILADQYLRWYHSPPVTAARQDDEKETEARVTRTREVTILAAIFLGLYALERIVGRKTNLTGAVSSSAVTTAARAAAGGR